MNAEELRAYPALARLPAMLAAERRRRAARAAFEAGLYALAFQSAALAALGFVSVRHPLAPVWLQAMGLTFLAYLAVPAAFILVRRARRNAPAAVARELDHANPAAPDPFRTVLSLASHRPETLRDLDRLFAPHLGRLSFPRPAFPPRPAAAAAAAGLAAFLACALGSGDPGAFLARASAPWSALRSLPVLGFDFDPPRLVLAAGDTARVTGTIRHLLPGQAIHAYVAAGGEETRYPVAPGGGGRFAFSHGPADSDFVLSLAGANGRSRPLRFRVVRPPYLARVRAVLHPPAYTRLRPDTLAAGVLRFAALPGTRVEWLCEADRPLRRALWTFSPADGGGSGEAGTTDTLGPGRAFSVAREIRSAIDYGFRLEDAEGILSPPSPIYRVEAAPDLAPEIEWVSPGGDTLLDRDARLDLAFRAKDDFGLTSIRLVWKVVAAGKTRRQGARNAREWLTGVSGGLSRGTWDLSGLRLQAGETAVFHFEAADNDTVNGPKIGRSPERSARLPGLEELAADARRRERSAESNLKSALQLGERLERKLEREKEAPPDEGPPMLADFEMNRVMVDDPRSNLERTGAVVGQMRRSLEAQAKGGGGGKTGRELEAARTAAREMEEFLRRADAAMPRGNQGMLPAGDRRRNLENLMRAQREQAEKLAALRAALEKAEPRKPDPAQARRDMAELQLGELAKELEKNRRNQSDLARLLAEQEAQAKARSDLMDQAIQEQMKMAEEMKAAQDDLRKAAESQARNGLLSPELIEKMKRVQDLLAEVLPDSLRRMMEDKLQGQEVDEKELRERLREMLEKQTELAESLNRALAMLEQIKDRRRVEDLRRIVDGLEARERALEKDLRAGKAGEEQAAEQRAIEAETRRAMADFAAQAESRKALRETARALKPLDPSQDMQAVGKSLQEADGKSGAAKASSASAAAKSAASAAGKLASMGEMLGQAMQGMGGNSVDIAEASEILQESLALSRLQLLVRSGAARRRAEGWTGDEASLYGDVARTAAWLAERVKAFSASAPFLGDGFNSLARGLAQTSQEAARNYSLENADQALRYNQALSRELLKLLNMAGGSGGGGGGGGGESGQAGGGQGGGGDLGSALKGMSGKQMAINQATYQLLKAMMEGRAPGAQGKGESPGSAGGPGQQGRNGGGMEGADGGEGGRMGNGREDGPGSGESGSGSDRDGGAGGDEGNGGDGGEGGRGGETLGSMANREGELGEHLESLAEAEAAGSGAAQKLRALAEEARRLEEDLRMGRLTAEEYRRRQERFQSRLLEASNAFQERGESQDRQAEASRGNPGPAPAEERAAAEARLLRLLREARREAKSLRMSEGQRKALDEYYETLLTR